MAIYIYGIINYNGMIDDSIKGLKGAPVRCIPYHEMGVVVSDIGAGILHIIKDHALRHEQVVERLMKDFTVLPFRFPTSFKNEKAVLSMMNDHYGDFRDNLERLRGKTEFGIKVIWPGNRIRMLIAHVKNGDHRPAPDDSAVKTFIGDKLEKYKIDRKIEGEADRRIAVVDGFFHKFAEEKKLEKLKTENLLLTAFYLVKNEKQKDFTLAFDQLSMSSFSELKYLFSGPWPPYNFIRMTQGRQGNE